MGVNRHSLKILMTPQSLLNIQVKRIFNAIFKDQFSSREKPRKKWITHFNVLWIRQIFRKIMSIDAHHSHITCKKYNIFNGYILSKLITFIYPLKKLNFFCCQNWNTDDKPMVKSANRCQRLFVIKIPKFLSVYFKNHNTGSYFCTSLVQR